jgi:diguanylate cyclase (GGDEF)-like protein
MNSRRRSFVPALLLWLAALGAGAAAFIPDFPSFLFLPLLPAIAVAMAFMAGTGAAVLVAIGSSVAIVIAGPRIGGSAGTQVPMLIAAAWAGIFLVDWHLRRVDARHRTEQNARDLANEESRSLRKEISFYDARAAGLSQRAELRRMLSGAAVELGAVLEPARIHQKLVALAGTLFPGADVTLLPPDQAGAAAPVFTRGQAVLAGDEKSNGGPSVMAAPVREGRAVVAALSVSIPSQMRVFAWEDLRLLDVLSGLASEALDNAALFNDVHQNALRDGLTGLLTHRAFQDRLESAVLEASRYGKPVSLIMADIDRFKLVNDTHGHPAGDAVLQGFAHVLDRNVRPVDVVARYGGEEFVIILYETGYAAAMELAEGLRRDLNAQSFDIGRGQTLNVTASFGVASFPEDATSPQQLLRQVDQRLYAAKHGGRNRVEGKPK